MAFAKTKHEVISVAAPKWRTLIFDIEGTSPYVQCAFSEKARHEIHVKEAKEKKSSTSAKPKTRPARDFKAEYQAAMHKTIDGKNGIPSDSFRKGMISACRLSPSKMSIAKISIFVNHDDVDSLDGTGLVYFTQGEPVYYETYVRLATGVPDLRARPMWKAGWQAQVTVRYDSDQFTAESVTNLMLRLGEQIGIGEGRPDSKNSAGLGWGLFRIINKEEKKDVGEESGNKARTRGHKVSA